MQEIADASLHKCVTEGTRKSKDSHLRYGEAYTDVVEINLQSFLTRFEPGWGDIWAQVRD